MPKPKKKPAKKKPAKRIRRRNTQELRQEVKEAIYQKVLEAALSKDASRLRTIADPEKVTAEREAEEIFRLEMEALKGDRLDSRAALNANYLLRVLKGDKRYISFLESLKKEETYYLEKVEKEFADVLSPDQIKRIKESHQRNIDFLEKAVAMVRQQAGKKRRRER